MRGDSALGALWWIPQILISGGFLLVMPQHVSYYSVWSSEMLSARPGILNPPVISFLLGSLHPSRGARHYQSQQLFMWRFSLIFKPQHLGKSKPSQPVAHLSPLPVQSTFALSSFPWGMLDSSTPYPHFGVIYKTLPVVLMRLQTPPSLLNFTCGAGIPYASPLGVSGTSSISITPSPNLLLKVFLLYSLCIILHP